MDKRTFRRRGTGSLPPEIAAQLRQSREAALAQKAETRADHLRRQRAQADADWLPLTELVGAIRKHRRAAGIPAKTVAERMKIDGGNLTRLETCQTNPTLQTLLKLADAVGVEILVSLRDKSSGISENLSQNSD